MPAQIEGMQDRSSLIETLYAAFNRRDIDAVLSAMRADVVWPNGWEGGVVVGQAAVRDYWTRQWAAIDPIVTPLAIAVQPDGAAAVTVRQVIRDLTGAVQSDSVVEHIYRFRDGQVASMEIRKPA